jgi:uncharacterized membrane protein YkvA (DUF1232 family)
MVSALTRKDVIATLGPLDDVTIASILASGASAQELAEAQAWLENDEPMINAGKPLAGGRVARLVDILATLKEEEEAHDTSLPR